MTRMNLVLPPSVAPFRVAIREPVTDDLLQEICETNDVFHIEREPNGELSVRPIGFTVSGLAGGHVLANLYEWAKLDGRGEVLSNVGFVLPDGSMRGPRIAWIAKDKIATLTKEQWAGFPPVCPNFVVEVMTREGELQAWRERMRGWIANGAELAWLVDPFGKTVETFRAGREPESIEEHAAAHGEGSVGGFVLELARIWG